MRLPTRTFSSFSQFASHLLERQALVVISLRTGLKTCTEAIRDTAKAEIGHYQDAIGNFPAWEELHDATKKDRVAKGFTENDPLLRSGGLQESIQDEVVALDGYVGSDKDEAVYTELGTDKQAQRSFLGPAVLHNEELIRKVLGGALVAGLLSDDVKSSTQMTSAVIGR